MKNKTKALKRICAFMLAVAMVTSMFATSVFAQNQDGSGLQGFDPSDVFIAPFDENEGGGLGAPPDESGDDGDYFGYGYDGYGDDGYGDDGYGDDGYGDDGYGDDNYGDDNYGDDGYDEEYDCDECGKEECECECGYGEEFDCDYCKYPLDECKCEYGYEEEAEFEVILTF